VPGGAVDLALVDLRDAVRALLEQDRHLGDAEAVAVDAAHHLLEERVAGAAHAEGVHGLEHLSAVAAEARGAVAHGQPEQRARVEVREAREHAAVQRPVRDAAACDVARADHEVRVPAGVEDRGQVARVVAAVAIHRQQQLGAALESVAEAREVRAAEPLLARAAQQVQARLAAGRLLDPVAGAVGAGVVDDEHLEAGVGREHGPRDRQHRLGLVVGRQDHERAHAAGVAYQKRAGAIGSRAAPASAASANSRFSRRVRRASANSARSAAR
jgi:hypothetical protein